MGQLKDGVLLSLAIAVLVGTIQNRREELSFPQTEEKVNRKSISATSTYSSYHPLVWSSKPWQVVQTLTPLNEGTHVMRIQFFGESFGVGVAPLYAPTDKRPFSATGWGLFTSGWINARGRKYVSPPPVPRLYLNFFFLLLQRETEVGGIDGGCSIGGALGSVEGFAGL